MDGRQANGCLGLGVLVGLAGKEAREISGATKMFCIFIVIVLAWVNKLAQTHQKCTFKMDTFYFMSIVHQRS